MLGFQYIHHSYFFFLSLSLPFLSGSAASAAFLAASCVSSFLQSMVVVLCNHEYCRLSMYNVVPAMLPFHLHEQHAADTYSADVCAREASLSQLHLWQGQKLTFSLPRRFHQPLVPQCHDERDQLQTLCCTYTVSHISNCNHDDSKMYALPKPDGRNRTVRLQPYPSSLRCPADTCGSSGASSPELYKTHNLAVSGCDASTSLVRAINNLWTCHAVLMQYNRTCCALPRSVTLLDTNDCACDT